MNIERVISWFDKHNDELVSEKNIDHVDLATLKDIFIPPVEDPLMYNPYIINAEQADKLSGIVKMNFDFDIYQYQLDCFQV